MKNKFSYFILFISAMLIFGCQTENKNAEETSNKESTNKIDSTSNVKEDEKIIEPTPGNNTEREPTDDEIREFGIITNIEDGAYPMFVVTIEFPERKMKADFDLNIEAVAQDVEALNILKGKYVTFYYLSELVSDLSDIRSNGISLLGEYAPKLDPDWKKVTGTLQGAEQESGGDLPDKISVTDKSGKKMEFEYFITPELVAVNGKTVTAYYTVRGKETITYMHASAE